MSDLPKLPDFGDPPLIEVVHGIQFEPLGFSVVHPGQFYNLIADRYPSVEAHPPLTPLQELFGTLAIGQPGFRFEVGPAVDMPRAWFISPDSAFIAQVQRDRLLLNWRLVNGGAAYPRYQGMRAEFDDLYSQLEKFATDRQLGPVVPNQVEITYISHISTEEQSEESPNPAKVFRMFSGGHGSEWPVPVEGLKLEVKYLLQRDETLPIGRLYVVIMPFEKNGRRLLQLELTARGAPATPDQRGVSEFLDFAHDQILKCFAGITTPEAHATWRRH